MNLVPIFVQSNSKNTSAVDLMPDEVAISSQQFLNINSHLARRRNNLDFPLNLLGINFSTLWARLPHTWELDATTPALHQSLFEVLNDVNVRLVRLTLLEQ